MSGSSKNSKDNRKNVKLIIIKKTSSSGETIMRWAKDMVFNIIKILKCWTIKVLTLTVNLVMVN